MLDILTDVLNEAEDYLSHYGKGHLDGGHSGRYPWGSGDDGFQRYGDFLDRYDAAVAKYGKTNKKKIAEELEIFDKWGKPYVKMLDARVSNAKAERTMALIVRVRSMADEGMGATEIGRILGKNESSIRELLKEGRELRASRYQTGANALKEFVDEHKYVDIGHGAEQALGMNSTSFKKTVALLVDQGYQEQTIKMENLGTNFKTTMTVLTPPGVDYAELSEHRYDIVNLDQNSACRTKEPNGDIGALGIRSIVSVDSSRIGVKYNEEGGKEKDGLIELRPGVPDIAIGASDYAQVRIPVDGTHYIKGMAIYNPNLPPGVDILVNSNKHLGSPLKGYDDNSVLKVMKGIDKKTQSGTPDKDNPYGATVTQLTWVDKDGQKHDSSINLVHNEGDWQGWSRNLASQFLSKQTIPMAHRQLNLAYMDKKQEFDEICALTNPAIKKKLLISFADDCDSRAVELKAAPFPGQQFHVIIPDPRLKDNEIYAPNYKDGTKVVGVRYPFAGNFEAVELTVRNTGSPSVDLIGKHAPDAVCINHRVAQKMSGADFDGDSIVLIPESEKVRINVKKTLKGLEDFDPGEAYPKYEGMTVMTARNKHLEMGKTTNLIMDMTLKGAPEEDLVKAVRHSMVIIDSEKHELNWRKSEIDNDIAELKKKWQGKVDENGDEDGYGGASTIITKAKGQYRVDVRKDWTPSTKTIDPETGEKIYDHPKENKATYQEVKLKGIKVKDGGRVILNTDKDGKYYYLKEDPATGKKVRVSVTEDDFDEPPRTVKRQQKSTKMAETDDAYKLTSGGSRENPGYPMEREYAEYANHMKALANAARKEWLNTPNLTVDSKAKEEYAEEIKSLEAKLRIAESFAPLERQAQRNANRTIARKKEENPDLEGDTLKKYKSQAIQAERDRIGLKKKDTLIEIDDREWEAIQKGAISHSKLNRIIENTNLDKLKKRATPHDSKYEITDTKRTITKQMAAIGYTSQQIADRLGISPSSVYGILKGENNG